MRTYKSYPHRYIGYSDIARLVLCGGSHDMNGEPSDACMSLRFNADNTYSAYIVDAECSIPDYYERVFIFSKYLFIYDDAGVSFVVHSEFISLYRCGDYGIIIQMRNHDGYSGLIDYGASDEIVFVEDIV